MSDLASLTLETTPQMTVARLTGELDLSNVREIHAKLTSAVPNSSRGLVLDLTDTAYLDSAAVQVLFEIAAMLRTRQQRLALALPSDSPVRRLLEMVNLESTAVIENDADAARAAL